MNTLKNGTIPESNNTIIVIAKIIFFTVFAFITIYRNDNIINTLMKKYSYFKVNKAKVSLYPIKDVRTMIINIKVKGGSWYEKGPQWGAFHFLEHLLFESTKKFPNNEDIEQYKQKYAISNNASTGNRSINLWFKFPDICINEGLNLLEEMIFKPIFPQDKFTKEINIIEQEYKDKWDSLFNRFHQKYIENITGKNHLYTRDGLGQPEYLKSLSQQNILKLHKHFFQPQNMVISIVGNFKKPIIKEKIKNILNSYKNTKPVKYKLSPVKAQSRELRYKDNVSQDYVHVSWLINPNKKISSQDKIGLGIISHLLGDNHNSILFKKIRQELGLVYNINSCFSSWTTTGIFEIWASVDPKNTNILLENIKKEVEIFLNNKIDTEKFESCRNYMDLQTLMNHDSILNIANNIVNDLFYKGKVLSPEDQIAIAKLCKPENLRKLLQPQMTWDKTVISIMSPKT